MSVTINAYCTHRDPPPLQFPHALNSRRDRSDPELSEHLNGFVGFILDGGERQMTQSLYHVMRHIERVQHHFSLDVDEAQFEAFSDWAWRANAVCFLTDGTVRDPSARILVHPKDGSPEEGSEVPYPPDAHERKSRTEERLAEAGVHAPKSLPPVVGEVEVPLRSAKEVAARALALFVAAIRAESLASNKEIPVAELRERRPLAFEALTPKETEFFAAVTPEQQQIIDFAWRYEALAALQWALGLVEELPWPTAICDVPRTARIMLDAEERDLVADAKLRPATEILDALDLHYRLHWAIRQTQLDEKDPPAKLDPGVIAERHHALNWLVRFEDAEWDEVDTPT